MELLSDLATIGVVLPIFLVAVACLILLGQLGLAIRWAGAVGSAIAATLAVKWGFSHDGHIGSFPSGHVSLALAFYGGLVFVLREPGAANRAGAAILALAIAIMVAISRVALHTHDWPDVIGGIAVGAASLLCWGAWTWPIPARRRRLLLATLLALAFYPLFQLGTDTLDALIRGAVPLRPF
jgi:membrane-associated phospholipid phosphatase